MLSKLGQDMRLFILLGYFQPATADILIPSSLYLIFSLNSLHMNTIPTYSNKIYIQNYMKLDKIIVQKETISKRGCFVNPLWERFHDESRHFKGKCSLSICASHLSSKFPIFFLICYCTFIMFMI